MQSSEHSFSGSLFLVHVVRAVNDVMMFSSLFVFFYIFSWKKFSDKQITQ